MTQQFEKLNEIYSAIKDVDKIIMSDSKEKLDDVINALKNIDKNKFDKSLENNILFCYRDALVKIYNSSISELNSNIKDSSYIKSMLEKKTEVRDNREKDNREV